MESGVSHGNTMHLMLSLSKNRLLYIPRGELISPLETFQKLFLGNENLSQIHNVNKNYYNSKL